MTEFGMVIQVGRNIFLGRQPCSRLKGAGPQRLQHFWDCPNCTQTVWPKATKFGVVAHSGQERVFRGQPRPISRGRAQRPRNFGDLLDACTLDERHQPNFAWCSN